MELSDFISVIIPLNEIEIDVYCDIITSSGLNKPVIIDVNPHCIEDNKGYHLEKESLAMEVAKVAGAGKSVIIGRNHSNIAFCYNNNALITFDAHNDSYPNDDRAFGGGYFLHKRKGDTHILGCKIKSDLPQIKTYPPKKIHNILEQSLPENIFLSLEVDVFNLSVTRAHNYSHKGWGEDIARLFGYESHLSFQEVLELSKALVKGKGVAGINIAGYNPALEEPPYKTAELLKEYLVSVLNEMKK